MSLSDLSKADLRVLGECLHAAVEGPFFPDWEFHPLFGLERAEVAEIATDWPDVDESDDRVNTAINNAMNNLLGYPHRRDDVWSDYVSVTRADLHRLFARWRGSSPSTYFDGLL